MSGAAPREENRVPGIVFANMSDPRDAVPAWADPITHRLLVNSTLSGVSITTPTAVVNDHKTVAAHTVAVALAASTAISAVIVQGLATNVGNVYVGNSGVSSANGFELQPGQATGIAIDDIAKVYVDAANDGDGVCFIGG